MTERSMVLDQDGSLLLVLDPEPEARHPYVLACPPIFIGGRQKTSAARFWVALWLKR